MVLMFRRAFALLVVGSVLGLTLSAILDQAALGEEVPDTLRAAPAKPTTRAKDLSRPFIAATKKVRPAVVKIYNMRRQGRGLRRGPTGSGTIISRTGHILTNRHVVLGAAEFIIELNDGRRFSKVKLLGQDPRSDIAIIRITERSSDPFPVADLGDSDLLEVAPSRIWATATSSKSASGSSRSARRSGWPPASASAW